jgi:hypothetical protein
MNRRTFLNYVNRLAPLSIPLALNLPFRALGLNASVAGAFIGHKSKKDQFLICGSSDEIIARFADFKTNDYRDAPGKIVLYSFATQLVQEYPLPVSVHQFAQNPKRSEWVAGCGKYAPTGVLFDISTKKVVTVFRAPDSSRFQGHCVFSASGSEVLFTAHDYKKDAGQVLIYSAASGELLKAISSGGGRPHQCVWLSDGRLAVANAESPKNSKVSNVSIFKSHHLHLIDQIMTDRVLHLEQVDDRYLVGCGLNEFSEAQLSQIDLREKKVRKNLATSVDYPGEKIFGESLSLARLTSDLVACTLPTTNQIILWNLKTHRFSLTQLPEQTFGVVWKEDKLWVNHGKKGELLSFSVNSHSQPPRLVLNPQPKAVLFANGRHSTSIEIKS